MSNTGITNDSVGGHVANSASTFGESSSPQDRANTDYGSGGTSAGLGDNVEKDYGEPKKEGGVKGVVNKITDKMNPSHVEPAQKGFGVKDARLGSSGDPTREKQTDKDINRE